MTDLTVKEIIEVKFPKILAQRPELVKEMGAVYQFIVTGDGGGEWIIDFSGPNFKISTGKAKKPDCTFTASAKNLVNLFTGKLNPVFAFLTGKIKFTDLYFASKLRPFFTD